MTIWKRIKRLWTLLTTEEIFDEHGSIGRRSVVRRAPRGYRDEGQTATEILTSGPLVFSFSAASSGE